MILEKIATILKSHILHDTTIIVGVSGGVDSVVLLHVLFELKYKKVIVVHINHMLRDTSDEDALFVAKLAGVMGYEWREKKCNIAKMSTEVKDSIENTGRKVRYAFFEELRAGFQNAIILTAHHSDDLLESRMMHLIRGSGLRGLEGMKQYDERRNLLRPLLDIKKEQLVNFAQERQLSWKEDYTNQDTSFVRNRIRHEMLPVCYSINPAFDEAMERIAKNAQEMEDFLSQELQQRLSPKGEKEYSYSEVSRLPMVLLKAFFADLIRQDVEFTLTTAHLENIRAQFEHLHSGTSIYLTPRLQCTRNFDHISIHELQEKMYIELKEHYYPVLPQSFIYSGYKCSISEELSTLCILKESVSEGIIIRVPCESDKVLIVHKEKQFHKPLKKYFIEHKIPVHLRKITPVIVSKSTGEVIALLGMQTLVVHTSYPCIYLTCSHGYL